MGQEYAQNILSFEAREARIATVFFGKNKENSIRVLKQQSSNDCGQTVLNMAGLDGHKLFPQGEVNTHQVFGLMKELMGREAYKNTFILGGEENGMDYSEPHLVLMQKRRGIHKNHWVIRVNNTILCPSSGALDAKKYMEENLYSPVIAFKLPFRGSAAVQFAA